MLNYCAKCKRWFCVDCAKMENCDCQECEEYECNECITDGKQCSECEEISCGDCVKKQYSCDSCGIYFCPKPECIYGEHPPCSCDAAGCHSFFCHDCNENRGVNAVRFCEDCEEWRCSACRVLLLKEQEGKESKHCSKCLELAGPFLLEAHKKLSDEIKECKTEVEGLKDENVSLSDQVESLKDQVKELEEKSKA